MLTICKTLFPGHVDECLDDEEISAILVSVVPLQSNHFFIPGKCPAPTTATIVLLFLSILDAIEAISHSVCAIYSSRSLIIMLDKEGKYLLNFFISSAMKSSYVIKKLMYATCAQHDIVTHLIFSFFNIILELNYTHGNYFPK